MKKLYPVFRAKVLAACLGVLLSVTAFSQTDVLVCGAASPQSWLDDVGNKLTATGSFNSVTTYNTYLTGTPTLAYLQGFDAVLVYTDYGCADPITFGNNLAAYIDGGGGVVNSVFSNASVIIGGNFNTSAYQVCIPQSGQLANPQLTLGSILDPCSPIMNGIASFDGGSSSYRSNSSSFVAGSTTVANWSNGEWLVATRTNVGPMNARRCDLNFYPPSSDVRGDFWISSTDGADIMANALLWVAGVTNNAAAPTSPLAISGTNVVCAGNSTSFTIASVAGATSYTWSVPAGATITSGQGTTTINVSTTSAVTSTVSVTADNACGPSAPTTVTFTINPLPSVSYTASPGLTACFGDMLTLSGTGASTYSWSGGITDAVAFAALSSMTYTVTGTDANGCSNTSTLSTTVNPLPVVGATSTASVVCAGSSVTFNGTGASSYTWTGGVTDGIPYTPSITDTYTVTGTDANGCSNTDMITVSVNALPTVGHTATPSGAVCEGTLVTLAGTGALSYAWTGGINDNVAFSAMSTGTYTVTGTDANGCSNTAEAIVTVNPLPVVTATSAASTVCADDAAVTLTGTPAGGSWSGPGVTGSIFTPSTAGTGTHSLVYDYTDANGCSSSDSVSIVVDICLAIAESSAGNNYSVFPNPNNGTFTLAINSNAGDVNIELVDLSGRVVYSSTENNVQTGFTTQIVTENLAAGTYMLRVSSQNEQQVIRIAVQ